MVDDLINRDELVNMSYKLIEPEFNDVMQLIYSHHPVDAVEQKHGHWIKKEFIIFDDVYKKVQCSNCHTHWDVSFQYCPNCGAKMDEVTE